MDLGITGETALGVGASEVIGCESAKALVDEGADVVICPRSEAKLGAAASRGRRTQNEPELDGR